MYCRLSTEFGTTLLVHDFHTTLSTSFEALLTLRHTFVRENVEFSYDTHQHQFIRNLFYDFLLLKVVKEVDLTPVAEEAA